MFIWIRCGDQDDYRKFANMSDAADYLACMQCDQPFFRHGEMGLSDGNYYVDQNYISIYWGGEDAGEDIERELTQEELKDLNERMASLYHDRRMDQQAKDASYGNLRAHMWYQDD